MNSHRNYSQGQKKVDEEVQAKERATPPPLTRWWDASSSLELQFSARGPREWGQLVTLYRQGWLFQCEDQGMVVATRGQNLQCPDSQERSIPEVNWAGRVEWNPEALWVWDKPETDCFPVSSWGFSQNKQYCVYKLAPHLHLSLELNSQVQSRAFLRRSLEVYFSWILSICCSKSSSGATVEGTFQVHRSQKWLRWGHTSSQMPPIMPQCPPPKAHRSKKEHRPLSPGLELVKGEILGHTSQGFTSQGSEGGTVRRYLSMILGFFMQPWWLPFSR